MTSAAGLGAAIRAANLRLALLMPLVLVALGGCADGQDETVRTAPLRIAMSTFSDGTFLPWNGSTGRKPYLDTIYEYLVYLDPETLEPRPGLAERWEMGPNGDRFRLWLRRGVQFQGGWGELTAADVEYTFRRMMAPDSIAGMASTLRFLITDVRAVDRYEVAIELRAPDIDFVAAICRTPSPCPSPAALTSRPWATPRRMLGPWVRARSH